MKVIVILINKFIHFIGKMIHKGSSMPGKIALKLDKNILDKVELPENIVMVTGSNGKTSTTEVICSIMESNGHKVGTNKEGSNQIEGVTTMILNSCSITGKKRVDAFVIEVDERYLKYITKYIKPKYIAITNLYRDQMTRNGHPEFVYEEITKGIPDGVHLILNTDDPLSSMFGYGKENVTYFGINKLGTDATCNNSRYNDGVYCPNCKNPLSYEYYHFSHIGNYECEKCGHKRQDAEYAVTDIDFTSGNVTINNKYTIKIGMSNISSVYNILLAFTVTKLMGVNEEQILNVLDNYLMQNDRVQRFGMDNKEVMLLTSKHENSISYNQSLQYIVNQGKDCDVVIIVDQISRKYFTSETSWLWDIDFELLRAENVKKIILAGKYVNDLLIRFNHIDEIDMEKIIGIEKLDSMMEEVKLLKTENIYVVTCFADRTKFMERR